MRFYDLEQQDQHVADDHDHVQQAGAERLSSRCSTSTRRSAAAARRRYEDLVVVNTAGCTGTKHSNVKGAGTAAAPTARKTTNSPVDGSSADSNVDLAWTGPSDVGRASPTPRTAR